MFAVMAHPDIRHILQVEAAIFLPALIFVCSVTAVVVRGYKLGAQTYFKERIKFIDAQVASAEKDSLLTSR